MTNRREIAVFGGGCFWCTEAIFRNLRGIVTVTPGYAGGTKQNPSYREVCSGQTGHAEVIKIEFDPSIIPYKDLLDVFWHTHNPTTLNRQDFDTGSAYRSIILYTTDEQKKIAESSLSEMEKSGYYHEKIVTEIKKLDAFYEAEDYHKNYYQKYENEPYCQYIITPKLQKLREKYAPLLKNNSS